jgi:hypothetical protein
MQQGDQQTIKNSAERCDCDGCGVWLEVGNTVVVMPDYSTYCVACAEQQPTEQPQRREAVTGDASPSAPESPRIEPAIATAPDPATHVLFGFQPTPATGRQRHLFGEDAQAPSSAAAWPATRAASTVSKTWPRPWFRSTPADARIARQYKADATPADLF